MNTAYTKVSFNDIIQQNNSVNKDPIIINNKLKNNQFINDSNDFKDTNERINILQNEILQLREKEKYSIDKDQEINKLKVIESEYNDLKAKYNKLHEQFIILKREQRSNILKIQEHEYLNKTISNKKNMNNLKVNDIISNLSNDDFNYEEPELKSIEKGTVSKKKLFELLLKKYDISNYNKIDTLLSEYSDKITEFDIKQIISNFK
ncbi:MAG: hypothetical protein CMG46_01645 [Candidatus Marinimicrobia bacterium]|nr:hypothetical protein [Candidatus Neomarinimicrobiota bacterium]|tara:strand:+ start:172 stop:789 length:618 start_codon:yes stop_codon:yes gene_type:complete